MMKMNRSGFFLAFVMFLVIVGSSGAIASQIGNGDYESGLYGWDCSPNIRAKGSWANVDPTSDQWMAVMSPFGFLPSELSQEFNVAEGDDISISFDYNLWAFNFPRFTGPGDDFTVILKSDGNSGYINELVRLNLKDTCEEGPTVNEWRNYEETFNFETPMCLSLVFELDNFKDPGQFTIGFVDNVRVSSTSVPIPASLLLFGSGLVSVVGLRFRGMKSFF